MVDSKTETIVLGAGCFWCSEAIFSMFKGVNDVTSGYAGGSKEEPTYEEVSSERTGHAEVVKIEFDPKIINLGTILDVFFSMHDPTSLNRQGEDTGSQYRSLILYTDEAQLRTITDSIKKAQKDFDKPIVTEVKRLGKFYSSEEYHKKYYEKHTYEPYCLLVIRPKVKKIEEKYASLLKKK